MENVSKSRISWLGMFNSILLAMDNGWLFLIRFIPIANIIFNIILVIKTADVFGKDIDFAIILYFLPPIGYIMLGFCDAEYYEIQ